MIDDTLITDKFDYWMELAKNNPDAFEKERTQAIDEIIDSAPEHMQQRLRGLQWRIDNEIKLTNSPMEACVRVNRLMMEMVFKKNGFLDALSGNHEQLENRFNQSQVVDFQQYQSCSR